MSYLFISYLSMSYIFISYLFISYLTRWQLDKVSPPKRHQISVEASGGVPIMAASSGYPSSVCDRVTAHAASHTRNGPGLIVRPVVVDL